MKKFKLTRGSTEKELIAMFNPFRRSIFSAELYDKSPVSYLIPKGYEELRKMFFIAINEYFENTDESDTSRTPERIMRACFSSDYIIESIIYQDIEGGKHTCILRPINIKELNYKPLEDVFYSSKFLLEFE